MKHFLYKKSLEIKGSGGGGGKAPSPPAPIPPIVSQYPNALVPPNNGEISSINSFSYAEMIDLISDGPIEGLVNSKGIKVSDDNVFEGIYLNNTPVKETSDVSSQKFDIKFLPTVVKNAWNNSDSFLKRGDSYKYEIPANLFQIFDGEIDFPQKNNSTITVYPPSVSISEFLNNSNSSLSNLSKIKRYFDLTPTENEKPFLTIVNFSEIIFYLDKFFFDTNEGGSDQKYPFKISIPNFSDYVYFTIGPNNLTSFNYFEMPKTFALNPLLTVNGDRTFFKNILSTSSEGRIKLQTFNVKLFIWSIYSEETGIKFIENEIFEKYLTSIFISQDNSSLFNYNLINSKFKNGNPFQGAMDGFEEVQVDTEYGKELIGPYKSCENKWLKNSNAGGVARVCTLRMGTSFGSISSVLNLEDETSDDVRCITAWPFEMTCRGLPYLICSLYVNYSNFDKSTIGRSCQEAIPITHYIANENVEKIYVSIGVNGLSDTNHIDLASDFSRTASATELSKSENQLSKNLRTCSVYEGGKTYSSLAGSLKAANFSSASSECCKYLLIYGKTIASSYILDGGDSLEDVSYNLKQITAADKNNTVYQNAVIAFSQINIPINQYVDTNKYNLSSSSNLQYYTIPNRDSLTVRNSLNLIPYANSPSSLQEKLQVLDENGFLYYCFGLSEGSTILESDYLKTQTSSFSVNFLQDPGHSVRIVSFKYSIFQPAPSALRYRAIIATNIQPYINYSLIFKYWDAVNERLPSSSKDYEYGFSRERYPLTYKYIVVPLLISTDKIINGIAYKSYLQAAATNLALDLQSAVNRIYIDKIYALGITNSYFLSFTEYFKDNLLTLAGLEFFLEQYVLKNTNDAIFSDIKYTTIAKESKSNLTLEAFKNTLQYLNTNLINNVYLFNIKVNIISGEKFYTDAELKADPTLFNIFTSASKTSYDTTKIYTKNSEANYLSVSNSLDFIFRYSFYDQIFETTSAASTPATFLNVITKKLDTGAEGSTTLNGEDKKAILNSKMQIAAGARLPAVVSLKIETGYEGYGSSQYDTIFKSYQFDIYGTVSQKAILDIGRNNYSNVISNSKNVNARNFLNSTFKRSTYNSQKIYLINRISSDSGIESNKYYLTKNVNEIFKGSIKNGTQSIFQTSFLNTCTTFETKQVKIMKLFDSSNNFIGMKSCYLTQNDLSYLRTRLNLSESNKSFIVVSNNDCEIFNKYFNPLTFNFNLNNLSLNIEQSVTPEKDWNLFPKNIYIYEKSITPKPSLLNNAGKCDVYQFLIDENNYEKFEVYTYNYNAFEYFDLIENKNKFTSKDLYTSVFIEQGPPIIESFLKNLNPTNSMTYSFQRLNAFNNQVFDNYNCIDSSYSDEIQLFPETYTIYISATKYTQANIDAIFNTICSSANSLGYLI